MAFDFYKKEYLHHLYKLACWQKIYGFDALHLEKVQKILEEMEKYDESYEFELGVISELN